MVKRLKNVKGFKGDNSSLKALIEKVGEIQPILINEYGQAVGASLKLKACKKLGIKEVKVIDENGNKSYANVSILLKKGSGVITPHFHVLEFSIKSWICPRCQRKIGDE